MKPLTLLVLSFLLITLVISVAITFIPNRLPIPYVEPQAHSQYDTLFYIGQRWYGGLAHASDYITILNIREGKVEYIGEYEKMYGLTPDTCLLGELPLKLDGYTYYKYVPAPNSPVEMLDFTDESSYLTLSN